MSKKKETPAMSESYAIGRIVEDLTGGKPYVFVVWPYKHLYELFERVKRIVEHSVGLKCIRADHVPGAGHDLLAKIHLLIERAELVIAEISENSPNVFYEVGYAVGAKKPLMLLVKRGGKIPTDLKGRELIEHGGGKEDMEIFDMRLREHLQLRINSQVPLLRDMLEADKPSPAYILASPKYPGSKSRIQGQVYDTRTFGDNLGVMGLITAFGSFLGEGKSVELISAQYCPPDLMDRDVNLYLIGSGKINPLTKKLLEMLVAGREAGWSFAPYPGETEEGDWRVALYRKVGGKKELLEGKTKPRGKRGADIWDEDYGIIVRGPHPGRKGRLVLIMAGPHSLGTGAACLAATRSPLIQKIKEKGIDIADKKLTFWALVKGKASAQDCLLDMEDVKVVDAGVYE